MTQESDRKKMGALKVLVMDDHPVVREGLIHLIEREPDIDVVADSGDSSQTLDLVKTHSPDVVLLDIEMEGPTFPLAGKVKLIRPETRVLFITAYDTQGNFEQARKVGAAGLISKMDGSQAIAEAIRTVSQGHEYFSGLPRRRARKKPLLDVGRDASHDHPLSLREIDVLCCVARAMTAKEIAKTLHISVKTVDRHKANIMEKLDLRSQIDLTRYAIRHGFVEA